MLRIVIPATEEYNEETNEFVTIKEQKLQLEHSLVSISKWEAKWCKAFLTKDDKTIEETIDYVRCMTITQNVNPQAYNHLTVDNLRQVQEYIDQKQTATTFSKDKKGGGREKITSEIIYYWMINFNIPFECQKWHINRLLTLIKVCDIKNTPPKKMGAKEAAQQRKALNAQRRNK